MGMPEVDEFWPSTSTVAKTNNTTDRNLTRKQAPPSPEHKRPERFRSHSQNVFEAAEGSG